jgi:hypothetical protein
LAAPQVSMLLPELLVMIWKCYPLHKSMK